MTPKWCWGCFMKIHILQQNNKEKDKKIEAKLANKVVCYKDLRYLALNLLETKTKS